MTEAGHTSERLETIPTVDETWVEVWQHHYDCGGQLCYHSPGHPISAGEECIEIVRCWPDDHDGFRRSGFRYCLEHAPEHIERIRVLEANRMSRQGKP